MKNKRLISLIFSLSLCAICLALSISYAWFTMNPFVNANGIQIQASSYNNETTFYTYNYDSRTWESVSYDESSAMLDFSNILPGDVYTFRIDIENKDSKSFQYDTITKGFSVIDIATNNEYSGDTPLSDKICVYQYVDDNILVNFDRENLDVHDSNYVMTNNLKPYSINGVSNLDALEFTGKLNSGDTISLVYKFYYNPIDDSSVYGNQRFVISGINLVYS